MRNLPLLSIIFLLLAVSCQQEERNLEFLETEIIKLGYTGKFERPSGNFQQIALEIVGVDDFIAFKGEDNSFVIFQLKNTNEKDATERFESVLSLVEGYISEEDKKNLSGTKEKIKEHSFQQGKILLLWKDQKPEDVVKIIRRNF